MSRTPYTRAGILSIEEVFAEAGKDRGVFLGEPVSLSSVRMQTFFVHGTICSKCGLKASYFAVERHRTNTTGYHLNLYGVNKHGGEVLFTHDHTLSRANKGENHTRNTTTMCSFCNNRKSQKEDKQDSERLKEIMTAQEGLLDDLHPESGSIR